MFDSYRLLSSFKRVDDTDLGFLKCNVGLERIKNKQINKKQTIYFRFQTFIKETTDVNKNG